MAAREGVRSSARLSVAGGGAQQSAPVAAASEAEREAAAALRRQRAARAAERAREVEDSPQVLRDKCRRLARALREAKHLVVYTGAGISTAADIPDYRGPRGVWTRLQRGETVGRVEVSRAQPTFTHMALTALWARGVLKFVVSQNCDGLHMRAGLPRRALAELHGDMFAERCPACRAVYLRAFDTTERTARHTHATRRLCHTCAPARELRDSIVHFGERGRAAWPLNWSGALRHAAAADVVLCLGSSLKVLRRYPRLWRMQSAPHTRPALYIVNLQWTPKDSVAALKINARCDAVMAQVARRLRLRVPRYRPSADPLLAHAEPLTPAEAHTTRRPLLSPAPTSDLYEAESDDDSYYSLSASSSTSDSDDELPLRRLADRLRSPRPPPAPPPPSAHQTLHAPEPQEPVAASIPELHSFQVNLQSGETTIILRSEHAPLYASPAEPQVARSTTDALRRYRITRPMVSPAINGLTTNGHRFSEYDLNGRQLKKEFPCRSKIKKEESPCPPHENGNGTWNLGSKLHCLLDGKCTRDVKLKQESDSGDDEASASLAAAIIRRAVLMCRAQLYPGLHTIIAPSAPAPAPSPAIRVLAPDTGPRVRARGECSWCLRRYKTRHCLWYGPPRATAPERRVWRRERGRRYLCACCGEDSEPVQGEVGTIDDGGWYGKGYRKGRRRRR